MSYNKIIAFFTADKFSDNSLVKNQAIDRAHDALHAQFNKIKNKNIQTLQPNQIIKYIQTLLTFSLTKDIEISQQVEDLLAKLIQKYPLLKKELTRICFVRDNITTAIVDFNRIGHVFAIPTAQFYLRNSGLSEEERRHIRTEGWHIHDSAFFLKERLADYFLYLDRIAKSQNLSSEQIKIKKFLKKINHDLAFVSNLDKLIYNNLDECLSTVNQELKKLIYPGDRLLLPGGWTVKKRKCGDRLDKELLPLSIRNNPILLAVFFRNPESAQLIFKDNIRDLISLARTKIENKEDQQKFIRQLESYRDSNHAMLYEIEKGLNNTYTWRIFNTGSGVSHHKVKLDKTKKYQTVIEVANIPEKELSDLINNLLSLKNKQNNLSKDESINKIYGYINYLKQKGATRTNLPDIFQAPQKHGFCSWKAIKAYTRFHLPNPIYEDLKSFIDRQMFFSTERNSANLITNQNVLDKLAKQDVTKLSEKLIQKTREKYILRESRKLLPLLK